MTTKQNVVSEICKKCSVSQNLIANCDCQFCKDFSFPEEHLCYLNQCWQLPDTFKCEAFKPDIKLLSKSNKSAIPGAPFLRVIDAQKRKEIENIRLQKSLENPDTVYHFLGFHFVLGTKFRTPFFLNVDIRDEKKISDKFSSLSNYVDDYVQMIFLGLDHIHLYVESNGEKSPDTIANELKKYSEIPILEILKSDTKNLSFFVNENTKLWDDSYFVESIQT